VTGSREDASPRDGVFILGAGRAGRGLARALRASGVAVALHGRRAERAPDQVTAGALPASLGGATIAVIAVQDAQLDAALGELLAARPAPGTVVLHASGSVEPAALAAVRGAGYPAGTFHPLLPLADPARAAALFRGGYVGVDGDEAAIAASRGLADHLGARTIAIPAGERARYHAAAVFASNFPAALAAVAERMLRESGVDGDAARAAVLSLMSAAVENLLEQPPAAVLTGPVARGDAETVRRHLAALQADHSAREAYVALSRVALEVLASGGEDASVRGRGEIERILRG